jgi:pseudaminic acid synthase
MVNKPFLIAEISANHCGSFKLAKKLILCAKNNGADAVKLQTYTPDSMTINSNKKYFRIKSGLWRNYKLWDLYNKAKTPLKWHKDLFDYAKKLKIKIFSTPFDEKAVDFLEKLNCPIYKVASFEIVDIPLIKKIAKTKKPIIISTGMANLSEIEVAFKTAKKYGSKDITLLYCVSNYPSNYSDFNLNNIKILRKKFKCKIGLSDHSIDNKVATTAVALGASLIEKHIALENQKKGLDIKFSLKGKEIRKFKNDLLETYEMTNKKYFFRSKSEKKNLFLRRSIFVIKQINKGEKFNLQNIKCIRPSNGAPPIYFEKILDKIAPKKFNKGDPLKIADIKNII